MEKISDFRFEPSPFVPYRDLEVIERCRRITRDEMAVHPNPDFRISIIKDDEVAFIWFSDIVGRIIRARDEGRKCVMLLPNPWPGYKHVARLLNAARVDCSHLWAFAMDEYADQDGEIADYVNLSAEDGESVRRFHSMPCVVEPEVAEPADWVLEFAIPLKLLEKYVGPLGNVSGQEWRANFYKCGDQTSHPHWASWSPVSALNFHLPECFGTIKFQA